MSDYYPDDSFREMAKWSHNRIERQLREREAAARADLSQIYDGYYPDEE